MEFWGIKVKAGEPVSVCPEDGKRIHISQAAVGAVKNVKAANYVHIRLKVEEKKFVIGTLSAKRGPQLYFDFVLHKKFELSHDWKDGSIYFCGYTAKEQDDGPNDADSSDEEDDEEDEIMSLFGKPVSDTQGAKPAESKAATTKAGSSAKPKVTLVEPEKEESDDSDESDNGSDDESDDLEDDSDDDLDDDSDDDLFKSCSK